MSILTPTQLKSLCQQYGLTPSKKYGQNYLINEAPIKKILKAADLSRADTVVEIGPGFGILTFALARAAKAVIAYEIEKKLQPYWEEKQKEYHNVEIIWGNFLTEIKRKESSVKSQFKVVANLPYQITSSILRTLLEMKNKPERIVVMVQKEVAERITARPGEMSLLSVSVQYYGEPKIEAKVTKGNFWPEPKVDSAILSIKTFKHINPSTRAKLGAGRGIQTYSDEEFFRVVKAGFAHKRKQLWRNLSVGLQIEAARVKAAVALITGNEKIRAEELSVEQWIKLCEKLSSNKSRFR